MLVIATVTCSLALDVSSRRLGVVKVPAGVQTANGAITQSGMFEVHEVTLHDDRPSKNPVQYDDNMDGVASEIKNQRAWAPVTNRTGSESVNVVSVAAPKTTGSDPLQTANSFRDQLLLNNLPLSTGYLRAPNAISYGNGYSDLDRLTRPRTAWIGPPRRAASATAARLEAGSRPLDSLGEIDQAVSSALTRVADQAATVGNAADDAQLRAANKAVELQAKAVTRALQRLRARHRADLIARNERQDRLLDLVQASERQELNDLIRDFADRQRQRDNLDRQLSGDQGRPGSSDRSGYYNRPGSSDRPSSSDSLGSSPNVRNLELQAIRAGQEQRAGNQLLNLK